MIAFPAGPGIERRKKMPTNHKEKRFLDALESLFTGAEVEGDSGFINLMRMKHDYFRDIQMVLMESVEERVKEEDSSFREELFDKLWTFFSQYFCESGSIYFRHLPAFARIYERVYAGGEDVALVWKTKNLYYVKSDTLVRSMPVVLDPDYPERAMRFYFDASAVENKRGNERREFVFAFDKVEQTPEGQVVHLAVSYSENGNGTKADDIAKAVRKSKSGVRPTEEQLARAVQTFRRQTEADFFINKDARGFLREQFDLWMYQFLFQGESIFEPGRIKQLQAIQQTAHEIIDFIAQFEDELRRAWEKPKFARNVNYVVTLDKLPAELLAKIAAHKGAKAQAREWGELGLVDGNFSPAELGKTAGRGRFLPLDTKHFKNLELEILGALGNLDEALDGELVHSENWQALNSLQAKYRGRVKCIYIDPPFNLGGSDQFDYRTNYKDSCWATMLENRLSASKPFIADNGSITVRCGHDGNYIMRAVLNDVFGIDNYRNEIIVRRAEEQKGELMKQFDTMRAMMVNYDNLYWYSVNPHCRFNFITKPGSKEQKKSQWHSFWKAEDRPKLRYKIFDVDLSGAKKGQWMWEKNRAFRAVENYRLYLEKNAKKPISLDNYWQQNAEVYSRQTGYPLEFIRKNGNGGNGISSIQYWMPPRDFVISDNNWTDIKGYANTTVFKTENSEVLLDRIIRHLPDCGEVVLDFFAGSGTTQAVAQKLGRKWLGMEMGEHFNTVVLPRLKKVLGGHAAGNGNGKAEYKGGGAFKYYSLEQYEETLKNSRYKGGRQIELDSNKTPFEQYVFFDDDKLAHVGKADHAGGGKLEINLKNLYPDMDIAESLANILGKQIRRRTADSVTFTDGATEMTEPLKMDEKEKLHFISLIKPYLWWGK